ncbi:hypothetical protein FOXYSP1_16728 [Fusarium oxysporum f. sp. phaseoli]
MLTLRSINYYGQELDDVSEATSHPHAAIARGAESGLYGKYDAPNESDDVSTSIHDILRGAHVMSQRVSTVLSTCTFLSNRST